MERITELYQTLEKSIVNYTGLSAATFFTVLAVAVALYYVVSGWFAAPPPPRKREVFEESEPLLPPVQLGEITEEELKVYDGTDSKKPLLMAIKGQIYDVTQSRMFYGPGGPYALFAGKDASKALAKMSFEQQDLTGDISGLGPFELEALQDWEYKFMSKYVKVGTIKKIVPVEDTNTTSETAETGVKSEEKEQVEELEKFEVSEDKKEQVEEMEKFEVSEDKKEQVEEAEKFEVSEDKKEQVEEMEKFEVSEDKKEE